MNWTIKLSSKAEKYFNRLGKDTKQRVKGELLHLSQRDNPVDHIAVKPLTGQLKGFYRLKIGDYRVVFSILKETAIIAVVNIALRGDVYKNKE